MDKASDFQRVIVLQGGGSLGAFEAGAFQAFSEMTTAGHVICPKTYGIVLTVVI